MTVTADGGDATDGANGDLTGTTFAGCEVDEVVGRDLISTIYRATDGEGTGARTVTLRVVAADLCTVKGAQRRLYERFHRHAAQALTFDHPNAPAIEEVGEQHGRGYLITTAVESTPFGAYLDRAAPLDMPVAMALFEQIADLLDAGQRAGLTHGAVSPSTLRIAADRAADDEPTAQLTGHGVGALLELRIRRDRKRLDVVDELRYVAPEQLRQRPTTGRTDQYAMACALVHALTGAPPFERDTVGGLFGAHLFVAPRVDIAPVWRPAVLKALSKEPRERYATCSQLIADLRRAERSAANRRRAAARRQRTARERPTQADDGTVTTATPPRIDVDEDGEQDRVITVPEYNGRAPSDESAAAGVGSSAHAEPVTRDQDRADRERDPDDDNSSTGRHDDPAMSYPAEARGPSSGPATGRTDEDLDDVPLLSEVLSRRSTVPQRTAWRPPGAWLILVILIVVAAAAAVWMMGT
ncbi:MAG: hypothetical protein KY460_07305 [Actinobacteria bacterium]|nr:hypothetical protein [Actinomycetota bacterium]